MNKRKRYRSTEWSELIEQWSRSGESAERFSARLGVTVATLTRWRKRTRGKTSVTPVASPSARKVEAARSVFTPVHVVRPARAADGLVEVVTRGGCVVRVHGAVDEETLTSVFSVVGVC